MVSRNFGGWTWGGCASLGSQGVKNRDRLLLGREP
jgi:hypothetical protein